MDSGARVVISRGRKGVGVVGTVFWVGEDRFRKDGKRLGIHGDDGETWWVSADHVDKTDAPPPEPARAPAPGDRVRFMLGEDEVEGEVFWVGPSKQGAGFRVGVRDPGGEAHWLDARALTPAEESDVARDDDNPAF